jgi:hypothetical protein
MRKKKIKWEHRVKSTKKYQRFLYILNGACYLGNIIEILKRRTKTHKDTDNFLMVGQWTVYTNTQLNEVQ